MITVLVTGCGKTTEIGVVLPLTGDYEAYGQSSLRGVELALAEWRTAEGAESALSLSIQDSQSDPARASQLLDELYTNGAFVGLGGLTSPEAASMIEVANHHERVLLSPWASSADLPRRSPFFYRLAPSDFVAGNKIAEFASRQLRVRRAILMASDQALASAALEGFRTTFETQLGKVEETFQVTGSEDPADLARQVVAKSPDAIFIAAYDKTIVRLIQALRQEGFKGQILTTQALAPHSSRSALGADAEGVVLTRAKMDIAEDSSAGQHFIAAYKKAYGESPDIFAAQGYDALRVLLSAITEANGLPSKVRDGLRDTVRDFPGVTGSLQFNDHGEIALYPKVFLVDKGHLVDYHDLLREREEQKRREREEVRRRLAELRQEMSVNG